MRRRQRGRKRSGAAIVEFALAFPIFMLVMFGMFEFGRAFMVAQMINAACRIGARQGVVDGVTTDDVVGVITSVLVDSGINNPRVYIIDGSSFDTDPFGSPDLQSMLEDYPKTKAELSDSNPRQLSIIRVEVDYDDVALITPIWLQGLMLRGQLVIRHE